MIWLVLNHPIDLPLPMQTPLLKRYPESMNRSLRPWSSADEYLCTYYTKNQLENQPGILYNDSFGYLTLQTSFKGSQTVWETASQQKAIQNNLALNKQDKESVQFVSLLETLESKPEIGLMKLPKSLDLFRFYLHHFAQNSLPDSKLVVGFMTRHFTKQMIEIAEAYFGEVEQSLAWKKSRLLILKKPKTLPKYDPIQQLTYQEQEIKQYAGVFSSDHVDYATQFLMENMDFPGDAQTVLDLACGNGILGKTMLAESETRKQQLDVHLIDDSHLAIESAKLNVSGDNVHFHLGDDLINFVDDSLDYVMSNPPFHVAHEIDISLPIRLFKEVKRCLRPNGRFQLVGNIHLNYKTHLDKIFTNVTIHGQNDKFVVYTCQ